MTAEEIAREIREQDTWDADLCKELCEMAGLANEWEAADGETFETVVFKAADILGVKIQEEKEMKKFAVIEDNAGTLTLVTFDDNGKADYIHAGYEFEQGHLTEDLKALRDGYDDMSLWDGNCEGMDEQYGTEPQELYDSMTSMTGWEIICDNDGMYPDRMGVAGKKEFGVE